MAIRISVFLVVTGLGALAPVLSGWIEPRIHFNFGPGDHDYLTGYEPRWEIDPDGVATHWSSYQSNVRLPLRLAGARFELKYRFSRVYGETAEVELRVNGVPADQFSVRGGTYYERSVAIPGSVLSSQALDVELVVDSHERKNRGLRMDWMRLEPQDRGGRVVPENTVLLWSALLSVAFWLLARICLGGDRWPFLIGASLPASLTLYGGLAGPFALGHVLDALTFPGLVVTLAAMFLSLWARNVGASLLPVVFVVAFLVRAGGLFHPLYYHPDLRSHADLTKIVSEAGLDFWAQPSHYIAKQGVWTQGAMGRTYAFPFSPVFHSLFLPFDLDFFTLIAAMKLVACFLSALEVLILFYLGRRLGGTEVGLWGAALAAFSPAAFSRLSFAFLAAVFAHFLDTLVLASLFHRESNGKSHLWLTLALLTLALVSYPGSLVSFGIFFPAFGLLLVVRTGPGLRRDGLALLAGSAGVAVITMAVVYREFVGVFLSELVPLFLAGESEGGSVSLGGTTSSVIRRYWIFYGGVYIPLVAGGALVWFLQRPGPFLSRLLLAWAFTFVTLIFLRSSAPDLFNKVKEILWVAPLISLAGATALAWARRSLPRGRWITASYYSLVVYYGISFYVSSIAEKFTLAR